MSFPMFRVAQWQHFEGSALIMVSRGVDVTGGDYERAYVILRRQRCMVNVQRFTFSFVLLSESRRLPFLVDVFF